MVTVVTLRHNGDACEVRPIAFTEVAMTPGKCSFTVLFTTAKTYTTLLNSLCWGRGYK